MLLVLLFKIEGFMKGTIPLNKENFPVKISMHNPKLFRKSALTSECIKLGIEIKM